MTGFCWLCVRNKTRRWASRHDKAIAVTGGILFAAGTLTWWVFLAYALASRSR
jgi:hypothetical protein